MNKRTNESTKSVAYRYLHFENLTPIFLFYMYFLTQEDHRLKQLVMELYPDGKVGKDISWIDVVNRLGTNANGRTAKQVRERWHNSYVSSIMLVVYHAAAVAFAHAIISLHRYLNIFYLLPPYLCSTDSVPISRRRVHPGPRRRLSPSSVCRVSWATRGPRYPNA